MTGPGIVGQAVGRVEGPAKVTGRTLYSADVALPGMLWGRCLRSPMPHAQILSIDTAQARALAGVRAVLTAADLPDVRLGRMCTDMPALARDVVRFAGEKVVAVAADTVEIAEAALRLIDVEYEELPAVLDPVEAMREHSPRVHDVPPSFRPAPPLLVHGEIKLAPPIPNVVMQHLCGHGDVAAGFAAAHRTFEHTMRTPSVHQGYIEPHACVVSVDSDGNVDVWLSNKGPYLSRREMAGSLGVAEDLICFRAVSVGGDFGGKGSLMDSLLCYYLSKRTGRPVKMVMSYTEELMAGNPRHASEITLRSGVDRDGRITAMSARMVFNCGAYGAFIPLVTIHGYLSAGGGYRIPHCAVEVLRVYTNTVPAGHMRSPGGPQAIFAVESHFDIVARELGLDPLEFRLRNVLTHGDVSPLGDRRDIIRGRETLAAAARAAGWDAPKAPNVGRGIGMYEEAPGTFGLSNVTVTIGTDGRISVLTGAPDNGAGFYTVLQQMVADLLQVPIEDVSVAHGDTSTAAFEFGASGSRLTTTAGIAAEAAVCELMTALRILAARRLNCDASRIIMQSGRFRAQDSSGPEFDLRTLMAWSAERGHAPLTANGANQPGTSDITCFAAQIAEVEVDRETGQVQVRQFVTAHDVGTVVNPLGHQGQIEGGVIQGIGQALSEHLMVRDGIVTSSHLGDYKMPTVRDIPELKTVLLTSEQGLGPFAVKAIGEMSCAAVPAAIANAVFDAVGVRVLELPITAEKIRAGLRARSPR
jgi:CO/xanthine dehydrogenase Mo-binding subunit